MDKGKTDNAFRQISGIEMFAIIAHGGRQYKVEEGQELLIDLQDGANKGDTVTFDRVLAVAGNGSPSIGLPTVSGASVTAEVLTGVELGEKLYIQKFRRRKNYRRRTGHRQSYTRVKINKIAL